MTDTRGGREITARHSRPLRKTDKSSTDFAAGANDLSAGAVSSSPFWKRTIDIVGASLALIALSPLWLAIAVIIKCGSRGSIFFHQQRFGVHGKPFTLWKFRTLQENEAASTQRSFMIDLMASEAMMIKRDPHLAIIPGGRWMRKLGLDELPQLINVLKGEMSMVGPRPHVVPLDEYPDWQRRRFDVLPGITGLWQVSGKEQTTFSEMMQMDIEYIRRRSLLLDTLIILKTIPAVLRN